MDKGICFLDIDGVVNTVNIEYDNDKFHIKFLSPSDGKVNNKQGLLWISKLCMEYKLDIIIISSWSRICTNERLEEILYSSGLIKEIKIISTIGKEDRNIEINNILQNNPNINNNYIILDDEIEFYIDEPYLKEHLILCDSNYGFGFNKYYEANELLKNKIKVKVLK